MPTAWPIPHLNPVKKEAIYLNVYLHYPQEDSTIEPKQTDF